MCDGQVPLCDALVSDLPLPDLRCGVQGFYRADLLSLSVAQGFFLQTYWLVPARGIHDLK